MEGLETVAPPPVAAPEPPVLVRPTGAPRVALIDTDSGFVQVVLKRLERRGWESRVLDTAPPVNVLLGMRLSAVVVDPAILDGDGWSFFERLGRHAPELAVVVCTSPTSVADRVRGLHLAADDWITKPCHPEEVLARIEAILRRSRRATSRILSLSAVAGELEIDGARFQAFGNGRSADLTRREFEVLRLLAAAPGKVMTREEIYEQVWGYRMVRGDRSVDVFVRKVRQKLERVSPGWSYIHTHFGTGYRFEPDRR